MPHGCAGHGGQGRQVSAGCTGWRCSQSPGLFLFPSLPFPFAFPFLSLASPCMSELGWQQTRRNHLGKKEKS